MAYKTPRWDCLNIYRRETDELVPAKMFTLKYLVIFVVLCTVGETFSKPVEDNYNEGRGIGSKIWSWLTYPFSWWNSEEETPPKSDELVRPTTYKPLETIEIGKHNVTIWCNDQTCTTMKCDRFGCVNITCNIYDTDLTGECREYNSIAKPDDLTTHKSTEMAVKPATQDKEIKTTVKPPESTIPFSLSFTEASPNQTSEERPLELEAVLSSTVTEAVNAAIKTIKPNNKRS